MLYPKWLGIQPHRIAWQQGCRRFLEELCCLAGSVCRGSL
ncbi:hypothetical protein ACVWYY_002959 [Thermostichus sp. MS-CIW-34]